MASSSSPSRPVVVRQRQPDLHAEFTDVDRISDAFGLVAIISKRRSGVYTFAVFREFPDSNGQIKKTSFVQSSLGAAYKAIVDLALERIKQLQAAEPGR